MESINPVEYLDKIKRFIKIRFPEWTKKFKKIKIQINPIYQFYNPIENNEQEIHRNTKPEIILTKDNIDSYIT